MKKQLNNIVRAVVLLSIVTAMALPATALLVDALTPMQTILENINA